MASSSPPRVAVALMARSAGHHLAGHESVLGGELVDDLERASGPLGGVDEDRDDRHVAAQLEEAVAVRRVLAVEAPDAA